MQIFNKSADEVEVEYDFQKRCEVKESFNKSVKDFKTLQEFQDYEELVECIIFDLVHGSKEEKDAAKAKLEQNERERAFYKTAVKSESSSKVLERERELIQKQAAEHQAIMRALEVLF